MIEQALLQKVEFVLALSLICARLLSANEGNHV